MGNVNDPLPIIRPTLPDLEAVFAAVRDSYDSGTVTVGKVVDRFEREICRFCGVDHAVAVSSCTSGLMLSLAALDAPKGAEVIVPSFTFAATAQAVLWNDLTPVYVDCLPGTMTVDPNEVEKALSTRTAAIMPVTIYGLPPDCDRLSEISREQGIPLVSDSAQGLGSTYQGAAAGGFGRCEVFSLSPTKVITAIEGGVVTTNDSGLAAKLRSMRDYGKGPDGEEMLFNGLSARMSEFHAAVGLLSLRNAEALIEARLNLIRRYRERAAELHGCTVQDFPEDRTSSGNYFTLHIGQTAAKDRDAVFHALKTRNIQSKRYFYPPVHAQTAFRTRPHRVVGDLPRTWSISAQALALPLYSHMTAAQQDRVCRALESLLK
ncbi:MAG: DegT/DnrJ/EryC1/StrS family aminotransferase [Desulfomonile tiedjei]|nr:DegT/DnrJ/EryC1/StrS family aminotransferase [Desulfomonile tiedjei]